MEERRARPLTAEERSIAADEERILGAVREAVIEARRGKPARAEARLGALASLREAYAAAGEEDRPAVLAQLHEEAARDEAAAAASLPDLDEPYLAHLRVRTAGRSRDVLLGARPFLDPARGVTVVDWRTAPIAEVLFTCEPGDEYEIEAGGRVVEGVVERRHVLAFERGELVAIGVPGGSLVRSAGAWRFEAEREAPIVSGDDEAPLAALRGAGRITALLDADQRAILDRDPAEPLLVLGSAGSGKTTVALHRVALLAQRGTSGGVLVIVPEPGLRRFAERLLAELSVEGVAVRTFDDWAREEARRLFPSLPDREAPDPPFAVARVKRHPAMLAAVGRLVDEIAAEIADRIDRRLDARGAVRAAFAERAEPTLAERLARAEERLSTASPKPRRAALAEAFREERRRLGRVREDHVRLVGDRALLGHAALASGGEIEAAMIEAVATHTGRQLDAPSEQRFSHVIAERLATLDGRSLDDGTPDAAAGTVDVEDYALILELHFRKTGAIETRAGRLSRYAHVVVDEAQELSPVELRVLGRAVDPEGGGVTVAGDAAQRIDRSGWFSSWEAVMEALGAPGAGAAYLSTSYRCPRPIVELAHQILGPEAPPAMPRAAREGPPVRVSVVPSEAHAAFAIALGLRALSRRAPRASVAVLCRDEATARALHAVVSRALPARLVVDGAFSFGPGVEIAEVAEAKGLEFDHVVVPDASARAYPATPEHRRKLHVAVTRAAWEVWLLAPGAPSPILPHAL